MADFKISDLPLADPMTGTELMEVVQGGVSKKAVMAFLAATSAATRDAIGAGDLYSRGGILGTVSQSGGVPTGAIIQRGSNANGEFVRFADGTQICTSPGLSGGNVDLGMGYMFRTGEITWTFPLAFISIPNTCGIETSGVGSCWIARGDTGAESATGAYYRVFRALSAAYTPIVTFIAIGRWY